MLVFVRKIPVNKSPNGFTLAELLVVIAIIGLVFAILVPSLTGIGGETRLDGAANAVHAAARLARQHAMTHNQPTYLVFNEGQVDPALDYRAFAVFTINVHTNRVTQDAGLFLTGWEQLPTGIVFDNLTHEQNSENVFYPTGASWNGAIDKYNELRIKGDDYIVLGFKPTGETGCADHWIFLAEGFYDADGQLIHSSRQGKVVKFELTGKSWIVDTVYGESGEATEL